MLFWGYGFEILLLEYSFCWRSFCCSVVCRLKFESHLRQIFAFVKIILPHLQKFHPHLWRGVNRIQPRENPSSHSSSSSFIITRAAWLRGTGQPYLIVETSIPAVTHHLIKASQGVTNCKYSVLNISYFYILFQIWTK